MKMKEMVAKYRSLPMVTTVVTLASSVPAFASDSGSVTTAADWAPVISSLTAQISVSTIIAALATFVTAGIGIVFMWWGLRKGLRSLMGAFRKGRMSI